MTYTHAHATLRLVRPGEPVNHASSKITTKVAPQATTRRAVALCRFVEAAVAAALGVQLHDMRAPTRCRAHIAFARQVAMYLAHVSFGLSFTDIGKCFARDRTTVAHACRLVEDRRDDPRWDASLDYLEAAVRLHAKKIGGQCAVMHAGRAPE